MQVRRAFLLTRSNEQANDVVHDAMVGVVRQWGELENPAAYLNRAVINRCRDVARRSRTRERVAHLLSPVANDSADDDPLDDALARLPFNQRVAVVLRFYAGWTSDEIADVLGCSPNSISPWITRALNALRKELS